MTTPVPPPPGAAPQGLSGKAVAIIAGAVGGVVLLAVLITLIAVTVSGSGRVGEMVEAWEDGYAGYAGTGYGEFPEDLYRCVAEYVEDAELSDYEKDLFITSKLTAGSYFFEDDPLTPLHPVDVWEAGHKVCAGSR